MKALSIFEDPDNNAIALFLPLKNSPAFVVTPGFDSEPLQLYRLAYCSRCV